MFGWRNLEYKRERGWQDKFDLLAVTVIGD